MIIVDEPFVAPELADYLKRTGHPVLDNAMARRLSEETGGLNIVPPGAFAERVERGERLYTTSENALEWITANVDSPGMARAIDVFKDKAKTRKALADLCPDVFFLEVSADGLRGLDYSSLPRPLVLKPVVGFCSVGVHVVNSEREWAEAIEAIEKESSVWKEWYPSSVIGDASFIVESYVEGQEFAIDAFYDESGKAHVLNVYRHDFASAEDTSDRLYTTGASIIRGYAGLFERWLDEANRKLEVKAFPIHVEVRVVGETVVPIEFNPLRFAGLGGTELAYHAYGFHTYESYLNDAAADWDTLLEGKEGKLFCMGLMPAPADLPEGARFDHEAFRANFKSLLQYYEFDPKATGSYCFVFCETPEDDPSDREFMLKADLSSYLR